ncbi:MAG: hypothetical protein ACXVAY_05445 [Mucilaginibacter sp.]
MNERSRLIAWDATLTIGILMFLFWNIPAHQNLIVGLVTVLILSNSVRNHINFYKLTGKIY